MTLPAWAEHDDHSRRERAADAPDSRDQIPAQRWAELAARHAPRAARHVGRESSQSIAGRLAALEVAHESLAERHAELVAAQDQSLADNAALVEERDAWRAKAADLDNRLDRAESALREIAWGHLSWFVAGGAFAVIVCTLSYVCIGRL